MIPAKYLRCLPLAAVPWVARYCYSASFGLYDDDFSRIPWLLDAPWAKVRLAMQSNFLAPASCLGRPLHDNLIFLLAWLGNGLGGLRGMYWIGFAVVAANCCLFYFLLRRVAPGGTFVLAGALAFGLYPADTTQAFLTHSLGAQPSLTFLLAALHLYLSGRRLASYAAILGSLLCYETVFPVFLGAPLLTAGRGAALRRRIVLHALVLGLLAATSLAYRRAGGEPRTLELGPGTAAYSATQMLVGPAVSLSGYVLKPAVALRHAEPVRLVLLAASWPVFFLLFRRSLAGDEERTHAPCPHRADIPRLAVTGLVLLILAYPLALTVPAWSTEGRPTRVHLAAVVGASILAACLLSAVLRLPGRRARTAACAAAAFLFSGQVAFGIHVQQDYRRSWTIQRSFWTDVVRQAPDLDDGLLILVDQERFSGVAEAWPWTWAASRVLRELYVFPREWKNPPRLWFLNRNWRAQAAERGDLFDGVELLVASREELERFRGSPPAVLLSRDGRAVRAAGPLDAGGRLFPVKPPPPPREAPFPPKPLHEYLILPPGREPARYAPAD